MKILKFRIYNLKIENMIKKSGMHIIWTMTKNNNCTIVAVKRV